MKLTKIGETLTLVFELQSRVIPRVRLIGMTSLTKAYIAGFLDGDGCIMLQLVYRRDYVLGYQIRASVVFYQKVQYRSFLEWLKKQLRNKGYIRNRKDGMCEYTIVGIGDVAEILQQLVPYLRLKKRQAMVTLKVISQMPGTGRKMTKNKLLLLARSVDKFLKLNYSKKRTNTSEKLQTFFQNNPIKIP